MSDPIRPDQETVPQQGHVPLEYEQATAGLSPGWQVFLGCVIAMASVFAVGITAGIAQIASNAQGFAGSIGELLIAAVLGGTAMLLRRSPRRAAWAAGIWIGLALSILASGICWVALA